MSQVHKCSLPPADRVRLPKLPPNANLCSRFARRLRKLLILNPDNSRCIAFFGYKSAIMAEQKKHVTGPYYYIIHPFSDLNSYLEISFSLIWLINMVFDPISENMLEANPTWLLINDYVSFSLQVMLVVGFFFVGYADWDTMEVIMEPKRIAKRYIGSYFFFDLNAIEMFRHTYISGDSSVTMWRVLKICKYTHVFCLYARLGTIMDYMNGIGRMMKIHRKIRKSLVYVVKTYMYLHVLCSILYSIPCIIYYKTWPEDSWLVLANIHPQAEATVARKYAECMLMAVCYFFGAHSGKYNVERTNEQICLSLIMLIGRLYTLYLIADFMMMFGVANISESKYERNLAQLKEYMVSNNLPSDLRTRMVKYCEVKLAKRYFNETDILNNLSEQLRIEVFLFSARTMTKQASLFKYVPKRAILELIPMMRLVTYAPGDVVYKPWQTRENALIISSGSVSVKNASGLELIHMEDGDILGMMMLQGRNDFLIEALETTDFFMLNNKDFWAFLKNYPEAVRYLSDTTRSRAKLYRISEMTARRHMDTCLVELRNGKLLERRATRDEYRSWY